MVSLKKIPVEELGPSEKAMELRRYRARFTPEKKNEYKVRERVRSKERRANATHMPLLLTKPLCAIDGEGKTFVGGSPAHKYTLFAASWPTGRAKIESDNLSVLECLKFIMSLPPDHTYVIFGGSYDTSMILRDLPRHPVDKPCRAPPYCHICKLYKYGSCFWMGYRISYINRKRLTISHKGKTVTIYDVLSFWQKKFVQCLEDWNIGTQEERELVAAMKDKRGDFDKEDDTDISRYCYLECDLLRGLVTRLREAILETPYRPRALYGPGALAASVLEKEGFKNYLRELEPEIEDVATSSYFGGRFDTAKLGWFRNVHGYDIRSAYPDQIRFLPCLAHSRFVKVSRLESGFGVYRVVWKVDSGTPYPPFPFRDTHGNIHYPLSGEGWYHSEEVRAALEIFGAAVTVLEGYQLVEECEHRPLAFVERLYEWRQTLPKEQGIIVKLAINSLYGKLAQSVGFRGRKPPFQSFFLAGAITAGTRAKLLRAIYQRPKAVIALATDGIVSEEELHLPISDKLGDWEYKHLSEHAQISNGVYHSVDDTGKDIERARGIGRAELDWTVIKAAFLAEPLGGIDYTRKRFIGLREGSIRTDGKICEWVEEPRKLSFYPTRRSPDLDTEVKGELPTLSLDPFEHPLDGCTMSQPYKKAKTWDEVMERRAKWHPLEGYLYGE